MDVLPVNVRRAEVLIIDVAEGIGTTDNPIRRVAYVYELDTLNPIARVDPWTDPATAPVGHPHADPR